MKLKSAKPAPVAPVHEHTIFIPDEELGSILSSRVSELLALDATRYTRQQQVKRLGQILRYMKLISAGFAIAGIGLGSDRLGRLGIFVTVEMLKVIGTLPEER